MPPKTDFKFDFKKEEAVLCLLFRETAGNASKWLLRQSDGFDASDESVVDRPTSNVVVVVVEANVAVVAVGTLPVPRVDVLGRFHRTNLIRFG